MQFGQCYVIGRDDLTRTGGLMKRFLLSISVLLIILFGGISRVSAEPFDIALGGKVGTPGLGLELTVELLDSLNTRIGINAFTYGYDFDVDEFNYDADLNLFTGMLLADWHCFGNDFRITGGIVLNENEIDAVGTTDSEIVVINDTGYRAADVGDLKTTISFNNFAPYFGIGWGNAVGDNYFNFSIDLGIIFQGSPNATLSANGPLASDPDFQEDLAAEANNVEEEGENIDIYPVIALGINFQF